MTANSNKAPLQILVDADACPVKDLVIETGQQLGCSVVMIASFAHYTSTESAQWIFVDSEFQSADMAIINRVRQGDIVVTQDYGLAALVLAKGGRAISPRGMLYDANMDMLLEQRHHLAKLRRGGLKTKGPAKFTAQDRLHFVETLRSLISVD